MKEQLILQIILIVLQELPSLILNLVNTFSKTNISKSDIEEIRSLVRDPWSYFGMTKE